jgi:hypothetical protein
MLNLVTHKSEFERHKLLNNYCTFELLKIENCVLILKSRKLWINKLFGNKLDKLYTILLFFVLENFNKIDKKITLEEFW